MHTDLTAEEQDHLDSRTLVKSMAKVAHRLYDLCEPLLVPSDAQSPPPEAQGFYRALLFTILWVGHLECYIIAGGGSHTTPTGWRLRFSELCRRILTKTGLCSQRTD